MKSSCFLLLLTTAFFLLLTGCTTTPKAEKRLDKYAPLATEEYCLLRRGTNTFKLHPNRQYALFNRTPVQLPAAPRYGSDKIYTVTPGTLRNIIDPLMTGQITRRRIRLILIDPGHGGHDAGAPGKISTEKQLNLLLGLEIGKALQKQGFKVLMTRNRDVFLTLSARAALVRKSKADLFISVHHNASKRNPLAAGIECFAHRVPRPEDTLLAAMIQEHLIHAAGGTNRGVKFANFAVLRNNPVPAVLIEAGFITNTAEEKRLTDPRRRQKIARAVAAAVKAYARKAGN